MKRIGILVVAYNAASTLAHVLDRIPTELRSQIHEVLVGDDHSQDSTYLVGVGYQQSTDLPLTIVRHPANLGYGGNQKWGYQYAMDHGWDVVVLLHGDGQYAPEQLPAMIEPIVEGRAEAVFGSRILERGEARRGGMPAYKYVGNRILTTFQNAVVGTDLSEWHSGYRAYDVHALSRLPLAGNADGFSFDTDIILQLHEAGMRIAEVPIPTYYGDEICYVNGIGYARDVAREVLRYRFHKMGFGSGDLAFADEGYQLKEGDGTSHQRLLGWLGQRRPSRVLDLGCSDGSLGALLQAQGHEVTGVDLTELKGVRERIHHFVECDLEDGIPPEVGGGFDVVVCADVFEHVRHPDKLLLEIAERLAPGGSVVASIPNFAHWYPRLRVGLGRFDYDARGILDKGHLRFFTKRSFTDLVRRAGWGVRRSEALGLPLEVVDRGGSGGQPSKLRDKGRRLDHLAVAVRPNLFAYQYLFELEPTST